VLAAGPPVGTADAVSCEIAKRAEKQAASTGKPGCVKRMERAGAVIAQ
jgi:hypothetical protein